MPTSIHSLPDELLVDIFKLAADDNGDLHQRACLALVSKPWCTVIYGTPLLWTTITSSDVGPRTTLALAKSQESPLDIMLTPVSNPSIQVRESFKDVCGHLRRWRTGWLHIPSILLKYLQAPAPLLETFYLDLAQELPMDALMDLFQGHAPRLRSVHLGQVAIPWGNGMLSRLEMLELEKTPPRCSPTIEQITSILVASPRLTVLRLTWIDFKSPGDDATPITISLPHLQDLHLSLIKPWAIAHILRLIESPSCRELDVLCDEIEDEEDIDYLTCLAGFVPRIPSPSDEVEANLYIRRRRIAYSFSGPSDQECKIRLEGSDPSLVTHMLRSLVQDILHPEHLAVDTNLTLTKGKQPMPDVLDWMEAADTFHVTNLDICGRDDLLERLATSAGGRWLYSALSGLTINVKDITPGGLERMIRRRYDNPGSGPTQLVSLEINDVDEDLERDIATVESILGSERVVWSYT